MNLLTYLCTYVSNKIYVPRCMKRQGKLKYENNNESGAGGGRDVGGGRKKKRGRRTAPHITQYIPY